jgi:hypothetical protein
MKAQNMHNKSGFLVCRGPRPVNVAFALLIFILVVFCCFFWGGELAFWKSAILFPESLTSPVAL